MSIRTKLILYFVSVILIFALIIGAVFSFSFQSQNETAILKSLENESRRILDQLDLDSISISESDLQNSLDRINLQDVRVFYIAQNGDINYLSQHSNTGMGSMRNASRLSESTQEILADVLAGQTISTEAIKGFFNTEAYTYGVPVYQNNEIIGALFLSATLTSISAISSEGMDILFTSLAIGLLVAIILGALLSSVFIRPLKKATESIESLVMGDYSVKIVDHSQDEIGKLSSNINQLALELQRAKSLQENLDQLRNNFIGDISHELRTPVTIIRGYAEGMMDEVYQAQEVLPHIVKETKDMQRLINDLLELSKLEDPDFKLEKHPFEWHELMNEVVHASSQLIKDKDQKIVFTQDEGLFFGIGDSQRLKQMFLAIIHNASKFSPNHAIISMALGQRKDKIVVSIKDEGQGMDEEKLKHLFVRYKSEKQNNPNGNGIGLLIVEKIAQKHDIHLEVQSKLNEGTQFIFEAKRVDHA